MSFTAQPPSNAPAPRGVSATTLILSLALAVCATAAIVLAVLHFRHYESGSGAADGVLVQHDTVSPGTTATGAVRYPVPFAAPPNLKITSPERDYNILKQDETGFTWAAIATMDDIRDDADARRNAQGMMGVGFRNAQQLSDKLKAGLRFEDFTWEAKGVRAGKDTPFVQNGTFNTLAGQEAEVSFEIPFANAPNIELSGPASGSVIVVQSRPTGFKWKNVPQSNFGAVNSGSVSWRAKGLRAADSASSRDQ
jgi:hypothetical protein